MVAGETRPAAANKKGRGHLPGLFVFALFGYSGSLPSIAAAASSSICIKPDNFPQ
jgi:hypothetical protein